MDQPTKPPSNPVTPDKQAGQPASPFAGKPLDGSQYIDVIEEQEYADRRPSPEEQKPRFSYLKNPKAKVEKK